MSPSSVILLACLCQGAAIEQLQVSENQAAVDAEAAANPIRRVVSMLQGIEKKIQAESTKEQALYDKYMCYCKNAGGTLGGSIDAATNKVPQVESGLKEAQGSKLQLEQQLKDHQATRAEAKSSMAKATAIREKEAADFAKEKSESDTNIAALKKATDAIEKGMTGFLQTSTAQMLQRLAMASDLSNFDRNMVMSFLAGKSSEGYVPASGQITGILKQMGDTMQKDLETIVATEKDSVASYDDLMRAKGKEVAANSKAIESKSKRVGELGVKIAEMKIDLDDTQASLLEDQQFLKNMDATCAAKTEEWALITKTRGEELVAISETIKILNDDDALELFKKTLPASGSSSFVQELTNTVNLKNKLLNVVQDLRSRNPQQKMHLDLISMALSGKKVNFEKVTKLIDNMVKILGQEQLDDDNKKEYCSMQLDASDDKKKGLQLDVKDLETAIADSKESIATLTDELKALAKGIKDLDDEVAESTETRKEEHTDCTELMASDSAAKKLLAMAKDRLNKFYNPKLVESKEASFVQISEHRASNKDAPAPPPESVKAYAKKSGESGGVINMLDMLVADLDKEMTEAETGEKLAQKEYESFMGDAAAKRAGDSKSITDKEGNKADAETTLEAAKEGKTAKVKELMATEQYISGLHAECDWLMSNFDVRKEARTGEIESLKNAKAVLAGADFSLVQQGSSVARALRGSA